MIDSVVFASRQARVVAPWYNESPTAANATKKNIMSMVTFITIGIAE